MSEQFGENRAVVRVLIVEDDATIRAQLVRAGEAEGMVCVEAACIDDVKPETFYTADLLLLDRGLPDGDELALLRQRRAERPLPTMIVSSPGETRHRIEGLDAGADDYVIKPFELSELRARLRALKRRVQVKPRIQWLGPLEVDRTARVAHVSGHHLKISPKTFDLLLYFCDHYGEVVTRAMLLQHVWNLDFDPQTNVVDVSINRLRQKFSVCGINNAITNVRGQGFVLSLDEPK